MSNGSEQDLHLLWEVEEIAKVIGRTLRQTFHMLKNGELPAKKVGDAGERGKLIAFFVGEAA